METLVLSESVGTIRSSPLNHFALKSEPPNHTTSVSSIFVFLSRHSMNEANSFHVESLERIEYVSHEVGKAPYFNLQYLSNFKPCEFR